MVSKTNVLQALVIMLIMQYLVYECIYKMLIMSAKLRKKNKTTIKGNFFA